MSVESPTLKIRVDARGSGWGRDCNVVAKEIVGDRGVVLDAKWGREPTKWHETGRGWGRKHLTAHQHGYVDACREIATNDTVRTLVEIIDSLTGYGR